MSRHPAPIAVALLLAAAAVPALGQQPAMLVDAHDKGAVRPGPGVQLGFFDPATGRFTPGVPAAPSDRPAPPGGHSAVSGTYNVLPDFRFDKAFGPEDSIFCEVTLEFGNLVNGEFFPNHYARAGVNFAAGDPDKLIPVPYDYTPNSDKARMGLSISCYGYDDAGHYHSSSIYYPIGDLPDGDVSRRLTDQF